MAERILFVDYENVQAVDLKMLPDDVHVRLVLGGKQINLPSKLVIDAHAMGSRFSYVHVLSVQPNGCDFCIAYYLGEYFAAHPRAECVILSRDKKGFDPLVQHLTLERASNVRRVDSQKEAFPEEGAASAGNAFERLTTLLKKESVLPRKRKGLEGKVKSWFPSLSSDDRQKLTQRLFDEGFVNESETLLKFDQVRFRRVSQNRSKPGAGQP